VRALPLALVAALLAALPQSLAADMLNISLSGPPPACPLDTVEAEAVLSNLIDDNVAFTVAVTGEAEMFAQRRSLEVNLGALRHMRQTLAFRIPQGTPAGSYAFTLAGSAGEGEVGRAEGAVVVKECGQTAAGDEAGGGRSGLGAAALGLSVAGAFVVAAALLVRRASAAHATAQAAQPAYGAEYYGRPEAMAYPPEAYAPQYGPDAQRCYYYDRINYGPYYPPRAQ
jgi:hypothetical protein